MKIRKANRKDIKQIAKTYEELLIFEQSSGSASNWKLNVYPTIKTAERGVEKETMYVLEDSGNICASMVLNREQAEEYSDVNWLYTAEECKVLVIHTLCIPPSQAGKGYGTSMVQFAKKYALQNGCEVIRIDTFAHNEPAKSLYIKNGFRISGFGNIFLQGVIFEEQVYLEYKVGDDYE
ncbi:MAG: GNAT family N-acetyltransferase [Eubacterium sp.]|nr:GNAT family N-acetyltransferase [Eubacterium sp.]